MDHDLTLDPGMSRQLRDWLHETADELPDDPALLGRIRAERTTSRRSMRPSLPWWSLRLATASAVAVSVVVAAGLALRTPPEAGFGAAVMTASPSPMPMPMPLPDGSVPTGPYALRDALGDGYQVSLDIPAGWSADDGQMLFRDGGEPPNGASVEVAHIWRIQVDPCHRSGDDVYLGSADGSSLESYAAVLASWGSSTGRRTPSSPTTTEARSGRSTGDLVSKFTVSTPDDVVDSMPAPTVATCCGRACSQNAGSRARVNRCASGSSRSARSSWSWSPAASRAHQQRSSRSSRR